jgi:2-polyprenyl-6-hydroxyphenyl methylase/3-demethylubiquinone-9 3-methyltransferase
MPNVDISGYVYEQGSLNNSHSYLLPALIEIIESLEQNHGERRLFELGCGNGSVANELTCRGWDLTGVDPSVEGIAKANQMHPDLKLHKGSAYDDLAAKYGRFPVVLSLEVVEHVYAPRDYARTLFQLLESGGGSNHFHPLSQLFQKFGAGDNGEDGCPLYGSLGSRPHQILVYAHPKTAFGRGRT